MVRLHGPDAPPVADIARELRVTDRQVFYYRQAAGILGFLAAAGNVWRPTESGLHLQRASDDAARAILAVRIAALAFIADVNMVLESCWTSRERWERVAAFLARTTILGRETCGRRATTVLSWIDWSAAVLRRQRSGERECSASHEPIAAMAKEEKNALVSQNL